jgi:phosphohistidine phosphatase
VVRPGVYFLQVFQAMQLLVIRHARAESVKEFARNNPNDDLRPLTEDGRDRMRTGASGLHRLIEEIDVLASSPLVRARQTAEIVAAEFGVPEIIEIEQLRPGSYPDAFAEWLEGAGALETIAIVGHDTHLSELVSWLMTGNAEPIVEIKKGAAVMLELRSSRDAGERSATLLWSLTPRQLRMIGRSAHSHKL